MREERDNEPDPARRITLAGGNPLRIHHLSCGTDCSWRGALFDRRSGRAHQKTRQSLTASGEQDQRLGPCRHRLWVANRGT
jgi:hypothetical protein